MYKKLLLGLFALFVGLFLMQGVAAAGPTLNNIADQTATEDTTFTLDVTLSAQADNGTVTFSDNSSMFNIQKIDETKGRISFTPINDNVGSHTIQINATDADSSDSKTFKLTVQNVNDAPVLNIPSILTARADVVYSYQVNATDIDPTGDILTFSADAGTWTIFSMNSAGLISFTPGELDVGSHSVTITVNDNKGGNDSETINFRITENCDDGALVIDNVEVDDVTGDDDQLEPGDYLDLDFDVKNKLTTQTIDDIKVKAWVEDSDGDRISDKVETDKFDVDEKDSENIDLTVRIDPDVKEGTYTLVIEARGEDEDTQTRCNAYTENVKVEKEDHSLLLDSVQITPSTAKCGGTVEVSTHTYNIGKKDEDDIKLKVKAADLGIEEYSEIFKLNDGKDVIKTTLLEIPANAAAGDYWLEVIATFNDGDDQASSGLMPFTVTCGEVAPEVTPTTEAPSVMSLPTTSATAKIGEKIKFTTTLTNTGDKTSTFTLSLSDVSDWAESDIEPSAITLAPGASMPVYVYITPKSASPHTITLSVFADGQLAATQTLTVNVIEAEEVTGTGIEITEWGHGVSASQAKALIKDYIGTAGLIVLIALLVVLALTLYIVHNPKKPEVTYIVGKKKRRRRR